MRPRAMGPLERAAVKRLRATLDGRDDLGTSDSEDAVRTLLEFLDPGVEPMTPEELAHYWREQREIVPYQRAKSRVERLQAGASTVLLGGCGFIGDKRHGGRS